MTSKQSNDVSVEFYFDCSSPWTYMGFESFTRLIKQHNLTNVTWKPIIVGGVFNAVNQVLYEQRSNPPVPRKAEYSLKDMQDWAKYLGLTVNFPPKCGHPVNAVKCMRACIVVQKMFGDEKMVQFARAAFQALWNDGRDFARDEVLMDICAKAGVDVSVLGQIDSKEAKDALRKNTNEVIARNGFGSPTIYVGKSDMYFGNDRMTLIEHAILRDRKKLGSKL